MSIPRICKNPGSSVVWAELSRQVRSDQNPRKRDGTRLKHNHDEPDNE